ncbi:Pol polyprotein [Plakobranchus ocellatus]|uniref:Pol polyprotein n=1 Tax=Plakobranchus ocellatus TaxID=259542 RepID=A0AAV4DQE5_9GAST|nr:Pol polyprotein [Plakobranchus ocellatus]
MLGREVTTPLELMFPLPRTATEGPILDPYVSSLEQDLQQAHAQAREILKTTQKRMKKDYDLKARRFHYEVGDAVYVCDKASLKGRCDKLKSPWKGPGLVIQMITPYLLKVQIKNNVSVVNHDHVKKCQDRDLPKWLIRARQRLDRDLFYCSCRGPDTGRPMVQCNECLEWYHCDCMGLRAAEARSLPEFICTGCAN